VAKIPITSAMIAAARKLLDREGERLHPRVRRSLKAIAEGERELVDAGWWGKLHQRTFLAAQAERAEKLGALADPAANPSVHERAVAAQKLAKLKATEPPLTPGLEARERAARERRAAMEAMLARLRKHPDNVADLERLRERTQAARPATDSVAKGRAAKPASPDSVAAPETPATDSVAEGWLARRTAARAARRAGLTCAVCGKPLTARRPTMRFCGPACRFKAWKAKHSKTRG
jgi:hypothetical protein